MSEIEALNNVPNEIVCNESSQSDLHNKNKPGSPVDNEQTIPEWAKDLLGAIDISHIHNISVFEKLSPGMPDECTRSQIAQCERTK